MRIDLHTHSNASDGTDSPSQLVHAAAAADLQVVAITDHDTLAGWAAARGAGAETGVKVLPGLEMSTQLDGAGVHLLGYAVDPAHQELSDMLAMIRLDRTQRIARIVSALATHGVELSVEDVLAEARHAVSIGRPHVADALVRKGYVASRDEAFEQWLGYGQPGHIDKFAPSVAEAIRLIDAAGGASVIAHPWGRGSRWVMTPAVIAELAAAGLTGLEVDHLDHDAATRATLRALAQDLGLVVTGSSDYHGLGKKNHDLGINTTAPEQLERLLAVTAEGAGILG